MSGTHGPREVDLRSAECPPDDVITAHVAGKLDDEERERVAHHLDGCESCRDVVIHAVRWARRDTIARGSVPATRAGTSPFFFRAAHPSDAIPMTQATPRPVRPETDLGPGPGPGVTPAPAVKTDPDVLSTDPDADAGKPAPSHTSLPKVLAGRYELRKLIGTGGMGPVYEALDLSLHRLVALKVLRLAPRLAIERAEGVNRLVREARAMAVLSHKNVVAVHDVGFDDDQVFVAMQLVDGKTLRAWLAATPRSTTE